MQGVNSKEFPLSERLQSFLSFLKPRVNSGYLLMDALFICLLMAIQRSILPDLIPVPYFEADLLTPWVLVSVVQMSYRRAAFIVIFASIVSETHSSLPIGTTFVAYWIFFNVLHFFRDLLSWRHLVPWFSTFFLVIFWTGIFEWFVMAVLRADQHISWAMLGQLFLRITSGVLFGLFLTRNFYDVKLREVIDLP